MMESFCWRTHQKFHVNCSSFSTELSSEERLGVFIPRLPNVIVQHQRAPGALGAHYSLHSQNHPSCCHHDQPSPSRHGHGPFLPLYYCTGPIIVREGIAPNGKCMTLRFGYFKVTIYDFDFCSFKLNSVCKCYHQYTFCLQDLKMKPDLKFSCESFIFPHSALNITACHFSLQMSSASSRYTQSKYWKNGMNWDHQWFLYILFCLLLYQQP